VPSPFESPAGSNGFIPSSVPSPTTTIPSSSSSSSSSSYLTNVGIHFAAAAAADPSSYENSNQLRIKLFQHFSGGGNEPSNKPPQSTNSFTSHSETTTMNENMTSPATTSQLHIKCEDIKPLVDLSVADNGNGTYLLTAIVTQGTHAISSDKFKGNLSFKVDGGVLPDSSFEIAGPGVYTYTYTSAYNELKTLSVDIIDSVLYSGSDAEDVELKLP
jgi:hypothetical protein